MVIPVGMSEVSIEIKKTGGENLMACLLWEMQHEITSESENIRGSICHFVGLSTW